MSYFDPPIKDVPKITFILRIVKKHEFKGSVDPMGKCSSALGANFLNQISP